MNELMKELDRLCGERDRVQAQLKDAVKRLNDARKEKVLHKMRLATLQIDIENIQKTLRRLDDGLVSKR